MQRPDGGLVRSAGNEAVEGAEEARPVTTLEGLRAERERITSEYRAQGLIPDDVSQGRRPQLTDVDPDVVLGEKIQSLSGLRRDEGRPRLGKAGEAGTLPGKAQIVKDLSDALGVPIRTGRFRGQARGIFKIRPEVIRSRVAGEIVPLMRVDPTIRDTHVGVQHA